MCKSIFLLSIFAIALSLVPSTSHAWNMCAYELGELKKAQRAHDEQAIAGWKNMYIPGCTRSGHRKWLAGMAEQERQQQSNNEAAGAFIGGFVSGFLGSYNPGSGRVTTGRTNFRTNNVRTTHFNSQVNTGRVTTTQPVIRSSTTSTTTRTTTSPRSTSNGTIDYITQPNGTKDPVYAKPPCETTQQTGPTSYKCTNN
jgi:hypothetical protein